MLFARAILADLHFEWLSAVRAPRARTAAVASRALALDMAWLATRPSTPLVLVNIVVVWAFQSLLWPLHAVHR